MQKQISDELSEPPAKVKIVSNILLQTPTVRVPLPISSTSSEESVTTTLESSASNGSRSDETVTPRKRKLLTKLSNTVRVSRDRKRKLASLQKKLFRRDKRIADMKSLIAELHKKNFMQEEYLDVIAKLGGPQELFQRQYRKAKNQPLPRQYSEQLRVFALTLHFYSPAAYNYVRRTFNTCLPHTRTLSRWYSSFDGEPGFTNESFNALQLKVSLEKKRIICSLIIDEMSIRQHEEWVAGKDKCYGYVDIGTGAKEITLAKDALVFLLNCINGNWKLPVGYFLIAGMTGEQKKGLVLQCLEKCHEVGVQVVSLTCDGAPANLTMAKRLGCSLQHNNLKTSFKHPSTNEDVVFFLDPSHMVKLVRNTLGEKGSLVDDTNEIVSWNYLKELHNLQASESFHLANKLRSQHIAFHKQKMKVRLATQLFSESVATALAFCRNELHMEQFVGAGATIRFILIVNNLFDVLNSRNLLQPNYRKPLSAKKYATIEMFLNTADKYISALRTHVGGALLLDTDRHTGFLGLKICIASLRLLFGSLVTGNILQFLPLYKMSQDHIELFFGSIRSHGGYNNNPTARQFQAAYKKLIVHVQLRESFRGNCVPLEEITILKCNPVRQINITSRNNRVLYIDENTDIVMDEDVSLIDHDYLPDSLSEFSKYIIAYIAGYVVHYLKAKIVCEECANALTSQSKDLRYFSFIDIKNKKRLQYPSTDVLEICLASEKLIKQEVIAADRKLMSTEAVVSLLLRKFIGRNTFQTLTQHMFDQSALDNHRLLLIKAVATRYIHVRMFYLTKNKINKSESIRHHNNKIVLFRGQ